MKLTLLGTGCMVPTKERNVSGIFLSYVGEGILFDCGEGTQRQMTIAGISRNDIKKIFITHWHADHVAGLLGLIQTMGNKEHDVVIDLYGPEETKERLGQLMAATYFDQKITINVHEIEHTSKIKVICDTEKYVVECISLEHSIPCLAFAFIEKDRRRIKVKEIEKLGIKPGPVLAQFQQGKDTKVNGKLIKADDITDIVYGKKIVYIADTLFCPTAVAIAKDADLLIAESTYSNDHDGYALKHRHMTSTQAAQIAAMANAKKLILTHISQRYKDLGPLVEEAKQVFPDTELGFDFMTVKF